MVSAPGRARRFGTCGASSGGIRRFHLAVAIGAADDSTQNLRVAARPIGAGTIDASAIHPTAVGCRQQSRPDRRGADACSCAAQTELNVADEFRRIASAATPGISVEARPSRAAYKIEKDDVSFSVTAARDGYVYVLVHGTDGTLMLLYPKAGNQSNRIRKGQPLTLPPKEWGGFMVSDPPGTTHVLVMVSALPRDFGGAHPTKDENGFSMFPVGREGAAMTAASPGPTSVYAGKPTCNGASDCRDEFGATMFEFQANR